MSKMVYLIKDESGSFMVESAIVFPIVMVVVLMLMTLALLLHDQYVSDLMTFTLIQKNEISREEDNEDKITERIKKVVDEYSILKVKDINVDHSSFNIAVSKNYHLPFIGKLQESEKDYPVKKGDRLNNVTKVELMEDIFDYLTFSDAIRTNYTSLHKTVKTLLESY